MTGYLTSLSDFNLIVLLIAVALAVVQLFLLLSMAINGARVTIWYGIIALLLSIYLTVATR